MNTAHLSFFFCPQLTIKTRSVHIHTTMGQGASDGGGSGNSNGSWGQTSASQSWGQTNAARAAACNNAQARADASCGTSGNSDLSGMSAGFDMVNQGMQCKKDQANADEVCGRK